MAMDKLAKTEPWMKWHADTQKFTLEQSGAAENIINKVYADQEMVKLYRGTVQTEFDFMTEVSHMPDDVATQTVSRKIKKGAFAGYFFSPDIKAAAHWAKGTIVSIEIPKATVLQWAQEGRLYAGTEKDYFEFSFFDPTTIKTIAQTYKLELFPNK
jgi:hypothetical protein